MIRWPLLVAVLCTGCSLPPPAGVRAFTIDVPPESAATRIEAGIRTCARDRHGLMVSRTAVPWGSVMLWVSGAADLVPGPLTLSVSGRGTLASFDDGPAGLEVVDRVRRWAGGRIDCA